MAKDKTQPPKPSVNADAPKPKTDLDLLMATSGIPKLGAQNVLKNMDAEEKAMLKNDPHKAYSVYASRAHKANVEKDESAK